MKRELPTDDFSAAVDIYIRSNEMSEKHEHNFRSKCSHFVEWAGGAVSLSELDADRINEYLLHLSSGVRSPSTIRNYRTTILSLLRFLQWKPIEREYVRKVKVAKTRIDGWKRHEVEQLVAVAQVLEGYHKDGVPRSVFWTCAIVCGYSTGLRWGDLVTLPVDSIGERGVCEVIQSKTGKPVRVKFARVALDLLRAHGKPVVLPWPYTQKAFCACFARIVERAEVSRGSFKWLRRTAGSYADLEQRGAGRRLLRHSSDAIFDNHYAVAHIVAANPVSPPPLNLDFEEEEGGLLSKLRASVRRLPLPGLNWLSGSTTE